MANTPTVYVLCDQNCRWESMTKEQIITAITQAIETGTISDVDTGFVQTIKTINGTPLKFFVGEQSAYDELTAADKENLFAIITNDGYKEGIETAIANIINGTTTVGNATNAVNATNATNATNADVADSLKGAGNIELYSEYRTRNLTSTEKGVYACVIERNGVRYTSIIRVDDLSVITNGTAFPILNTPSSGVYTLSAVCARYYIADGSPIGWGFIQADDGGVNSIATKLVSVYRICST